MDKVYRCANCGGLYEIKVSQCDCMPSDQTFTEHAVMPWDEATRLIAEIARLTAELAARPDPHDVFASGKEFGMKVAEAERDKCKAILEDLHREAKLCDAHGITLQFVQYVLTKTAEAERP